MLKRVPVETLAKLTSHPDLEHHAVLPGAARELLGSTMQEHGQLGLVFVWREWLIAGYGHIELAQVAGIEELIVVCLDDLSELEIADCVNFENAKYATWGGT